MGRCLMRPVSMSYLGSKAGLSLMRPPRAGELRGQKPQRSQRGFPPHLAGHADDHEGLGLLDGVRAPVVVEQSALEKYFLPPLWWH